MYKLCRAIKNWSTGLIPSVAFITEWVKAGIPKWLNAFEPLLNLVVSQWWLQPLLGVLIVAGRTGEKCSSSPWTLEAISTLFEHNRKVLFKNTGPNLLDNHFRITLFKKSRRRFRSCGGAWYWPWGAWRYPWSGWLVPVARSGYTSQKVESVFYVPEDEPDRAEGVAGRAWAETRMVHIDNLPVLTTSSTETEILSYAKESKVPREWVDRKLLKPKPLPLSILAAPIFVKNRLWGVVVLDSVEAGSILAPVGNMYEYYNQFCMMLGKILEKE